MQLFVLQLIQNSDALKNAKIDLMINFFLKAKTID